MGRVNTAISPKLRGNYEEISFEMRFDCKPQAWLKTGEVPIEITGTTPVKIVNPTLHSASPLIRIYGTNGSLMINDVEVTFADVDEYVDIDCEIMDAYKGATNCNSKISLLGSDYIELKAGQNLITLISGVTKLVITPRWWII